MPPKEGSGLTTTLSFGGHGGEYAHRMRYCRSYSIWYVTFTSALKPTSRGVTGICADSGDATCS